MNYDQRTQVVLTESQWIDIKCALWDSHEKWEQLQNESMCDKMAELRDLIHSQTRRGQSHN